MKLLNVVAYKQALNIRHAMLFHHFKTMFPQFNDGKVVILMGSPTIIKVEFRQLNFQLNIIEDIFPHLRFVFIYIVAEKWFLFA